VERPLDKSSVALEANGAGGVESRRDGTRMTFGPGGVGPYGDRSRWDETRMAFAPGGMGPGWRSLPVGLGAMAMDPGGVGRYSVGSRMGFGFGGRLDPGLGLGLGFLTGWFEGWERGREWCATARSAPGSGLIRGPTAREAPLRSHRPRAG
jgi:hypothetical protein